MGDTPHTIDRLRQVRSFADCTDDELASIDDLMKEVSIPAGAILTHEGDSRQDLIVIIEGHASVEKDGVEVAGVMEGSFVGEMALLDSAHRSATVRAITPLRAYVLSASEFQSLLDRAPTLRAKIEKAAAERRA